MESLFDRVFRLLETATSTMQRADFRERFANREQWEVEGPHYKHTAQVAWFAAKQLICDNIDELKAEVAKSETSNQHRTVAAAIEVVENEMNQEMEDVLGEEEDTSQNEWDGDEYLGPPDDFAEDWHPDDQ